MTTQSAPIVSLQAPTDVSLSEVNAELGKIWNSYNATGNGGDFPAATRAATFTLVVYEPSETQQLLAALGFYTGPIDGIFGPRMQAALRSAQEAYGLPVTGKATSETLDKLQQALAQKQGQPATAGEPPQYALDAGGAGLADAISSQNPCRVITLCPIGGTDQGVTAQVSAYCPVKKQNRSSLICGEYIMLKGNRGGPGACGGLSAIPADWWLASVSVVEGDARY